MFICIDTTGCCATGKTLEECWINYEEEFGEDTIKDCTFYEGTKIDIELKITKKVIPIKKER